LWSHPCWSGIPSFSTVTKEEIAFICHWVDHTSLTHGCLLWGEMASLSISCGVSLAVAHIFVDCPHCGGAHRMYYLNDAQSDILGDVHCSVLVFWLL
jgi:hypothetical protein